MYWWIKNQTFLIILYWLYMHSALIIIGYVHSCSHDHVYPWGAYISYGPYGHTSAIQTTIFYGWKWLTGQSQFCIAMINGPGRHLIYIPHYTWDWDTFALREAQTANLPAHWDHSGSPQLCYLSWPRRLLLNLCMAFESLNSIAFLAAGHSMTECNEGALSNSW